jgi:hypothetical protein
MPEKSSFLDCVRANFGHWTSKRRNPRETAGVVGKHAASSQFEPVRPGRHLQAVELATALWVWSQSVGS